MEDRQKLEQMVKEINQLQQQGETITQQIEQLNVSLNDIRSAQEAVKGIKGATGKETLIPIGAGCFITTELKNEDIIVGVGSDVAIKRSREETEETLKQDKEEVEKLIRSLTEQLQKINDYITQRRPEVERLMKETGVQ
ncbi:prefoldin subunit alpha [Methanosphaera sp. ISO3-F5]|uniref:prefoldin subunit alpha n=1 Tax=Methanosphaera sp. ISO3-F5 TaxID=1452353 RepID=UPI002B26462C|nr:prefoldin subunit alpha [Methanosphaera sp. ISO3-F5]WQH63341.1 prefoldin subunit alpha [Methanosphaera sp. ISO3-F5]